MTYLPHTPTDIAGMLASIGIERVEDMFEVVPSEFRFPVLNLPSGLSQLETTRRLKSLANHNDTADDIPIFLGAGCYHHFCPAVVDYIIQRGEFLTSYTPYQPEVSQGTLQAIFEYQSMICALTGMETANASHYDGATALAEAIMMAVNVAQHSRHRVLLSRGIHHEYREVCKTYVQGTEVEIAEFDIDDPLENLPDNDIALIAIQYPNFFGQIEDIESAIDCAHECGALACVVVGDPIALGLLKEPGALGADIVVGEGQGFGLPMSFGGPYLGFFATREKYVRRMPGRLVGETQDVKGNRGYVLTLATREQHIRREKATSNICTNQGLMALAAAVYLSTMGPHGIRRVAELCFHRAHYAADQIEARSGLSVDRSKPFFHEFVVSCNQPVSLVNRSLRARFGTIGGFDLGRVYPNRTHQMLVAVTEMNSREELDAFATALGDIAT